MYERMRPQENIVKLIITKHIEVLEVVRLSSGIGVQIDVLDRLNLLDLAMDIIGFPQGNVSEFDIDIILNGISTAPGKRNDFENMFDREPYKENEWDLNKKDVNLFVQNLYNDLDELLLLKPHLFIKKLS